MTFPNSLKFHTLTPKPSGVDFRLFSVTQKTLEESATNQLGR